MRRRKVVVEAEVVKRGKPRITVSTGENKGKFVCTITLPMLSESSQRNVRKGYRRRGEALYHEEEGVR